MTARDWLVEMIEDALESGFCGKIEINMFKGGVTNVNRTESLKPPVVEFVGR